MKASAVHLRWYKSFNINYLGYDDRQPDIVKRPWNHLSSPSDSAYRFIEIPLRSDITTIVGGNESGKSHLLSGLRKVIHGEGIPETDGSRSEFNVTDLCHYASVRDKNASSWPNVGATFSDVDTLEVQELVKAGGGDAPQGDCTEVTLILAHDGEQEAMLYFGRQEIPVPLNARQLASVRSLLPAVEFIRSKVPLSGELPIDDLLAEGMRTKNSYVDFEHAQEAARILLSLSFGKDNKLSDELQKSVTNFQQRDSKKPQRSSVTEKTLEYQLFRDVLGVDDSAIELLASIKPKDRGFAEGLVATWNQELDRTLNLKRFWQQDDQFSLSINFKGGWFYFEIRDKTGSVYTFRERSSGLRFFLSYYIQAKSIESRFRNDGCIILMDEPDSAIPGLQETPGFQGSPARGLRNARGQTRVHS